MYKSLKSLIKFGFEYRSVIFFGNYVKNQFDKFSSTISSVQNYYLMGIETSCDDTGLAIINNAGNIIIDELASQTSLSVLLGGVLPTIAAELHNQNINFLMNSIIHQSNFDLKNLSCLAVTVKPGMPLSLKIGVEFAKKFARKLQIPIIPIHHMEAHALTALLTDSNLKFPYLIVLLSGGHALLGIVRTLEDFVLLGTALDASPGDVLDKLARCLKLSRINNQRLKDVSGGHAVELMAKLYKGNHRQYDLPIPRSQSRDCDFSFTGIHIAAEQLIKRLENSNRSSLAINDEQDFIGSLSLKCIADICASIQYAMVRLICRRVQRAIEYTLSNQFVSSNGLTALVVSGGVGANQVIRSGLMQIADHYGLRFVAPPANLCTDNGVMIAWNGLLLYRAGLRIIHDIDSIDFEPKAPFGLNHRDMVREANLSISPIKLSESIFNND